MKLGHIELFVRDPMASRNFYEEVLGFEVATVQQETFVWLVSGGTEILLRPGKPENSPPTYQEASNAFVLYTDDLATTAQHLQEKGVTIEGTDGSDDCLTFRDPDGHWFQLVNPTG